MELAEVLSRSNERGGAELEPAPIDLPRAAALTAALLVLGVGLSRVELPSGSFRAAAATRDVPIYVGKLAAGWQDWSWARREMSATEVAYHEKPVIRMELDSFQGLYLHTEGLDTTGASAVWVWVNGGAAGGQKVNVCAVDANKKFLPAVDLGRFTSAGRIPASRWNLAMIPLSRLRASRTRITGIVFQDAAGKRQPALFLADLVLKANPERAVAPVMVHVDTNRNAHPISPLIYGLAGGSQAMQKDLRIALLRWGGNPNTRYNWERGNSWNAARDWEFRNGNYGNNKPADRIASSAADRFVLGAREVGASCLLTIPTIGWVARDDNNDNRSVGVPASGGTPLAPSSEAIKGYDPAANRRMTSVRSFARKRGLFAFPPELRDEAVYQDEWVAHLVAKFGTAAKGGVRFYAMDNEPDLWATTHTDVHPVLPGYDDLLSTFLEYATAVKAVDPSAMVTGPVSWGWTGYLHSPRDLGRWNDRPDRKAHGDTPFIPWFLSQVREHDKRTGKRTLDVLDVHFYPQGDGVFGGKTDPAANALRLRSTRGLWDPAYRDESWIGEPVNLIPRMKAWIDSSYAGTRLGITEWNWGADNTMAGGLAVAECLGIFGREGVYLANYWTAPPDGSPGALAFKMYRNADGHGNGFGDRSISAVSTDLESVSSFGSVDTRTGQPVIMLINKQPDRDVPVTVTINHTGPLGTASVWRLAGTSRSIAREGYLDFKGSAPTVVRLPAYSMTLLRFSSPAAR